ncbi:MAG: acyltransferase [Acidimicrobiales bacterium]
MSLEASTGRPDDQTGAQNHFVGRQVARIRRLSQPRDVLREILTKYLLPSNLFPEWLIFRTLKVSGFVVAQPCGFSAARIQTPSLTVGSRSWANRGVYIEGRGAVCIGDDVLIGPEVLIVTSTHTRADGGRVRASSTYLPVRIGDHCWLGARAVILPGVTIADDVTVAAGAVVASDIGPGGLYGGVPARRLR